MSTYFEKLKTLLAELFQLDQADLDFGIYRIMNVKRAEITQFLESDLLPQVKQAFSQFQPMERSNIEKELQQLIANAQAVDVDPETLPKVKAKRAQLAEAVDLTALENEIYSRLYDFFRRYYKDGDFISQRRYREGVYAIPYEGEEVKLYWANHDQYYIKSAETLTSYAFTIGEPTVQNAALSRVRFELVAASTEQNNVKATGDKERFFFIHAANSVSEDGGDLVIHFEYRPHGGSTKTKQADLNVETVKTVMASAAPAWRAMLATKAPTPTNPGRTVLEKHVATFTAINTFDYFIHKDLDGFLRRELDFYIKNEMVHLDDIDQVTDGALLQQTLSKVRVMRQIAHKLIAFLAQIEDFQKRLWLKKKFVLETNWCITLHRISEEFYPEIAANDAQWEEWKKVLRIDEEQTDLFTSDLNKQDRRIVFLKAHPTLMIDTRYFGTEYEERLLSSVIGLDQVTQGVLAYGDNWQALNLMSEYNRSMVQCIYIDPPYNTDASSIIYKNDYKHSSWLSLLASTVAVAKEYLRSNGILCCAIDDEEVSEARYLLSSLFAKSLGIAVVRSNPQSRKTKGKFSPTHEYALFYGVSPESTPGSLEITEKRLARYPQEDDKGRYSWMTFIRAGNNDKREDRPKLYYPIFVARDNTIRVPTMTWSNTTGKDGEYIIDESPRDDETVVFPVEISSTSKNEVVEKNWQRGPDRVSNEPEEFRVRRDRNGKVRIDFKTRLDEDSAPSSWWDNNDYASANYGAAELKSLFGHKPFDFPKAISLVTDCLRAANATPSTRVLDFFAGSCTTGHAVINLNREDDGRRKFVLIEIGDHFYTVLLPRLKKVTFTPEWKDGKPKRMATPQEIERGPQVIKYISVESYEDTLDNLAPLKPSPAQQALLNSAPSAREAYMLGYMLDAETQSSLSLLNVARFRNPFNYQLKITRNGETKEVVVDLVETFNYLLGLRVDLMAERIHRNADFVRDEHGRLVVKDGRTRPCAAGEGWTFRRIEGHTPQDEKVLVIWRTLTDATEQDNAMLEAYLEQLKISSRDYEYALIYVNGDCNLEPPPGQNWKIRLIEADFHRLMFDVQDV